MAFDTDSQGALSALLAAAKRAGADASEASLAAREAISADVRLGELEGMEREEGRSIALRAFVGKRQASASTTDLSASGLQALADRTVAMARAAPEDPFCGLLEPGYQAAGPWQELEQSDAARPSASQLLELARSCEAASLAIPGIANSGGGGASAEVASFAYATSDGFYGAEHATSFSLGTQPVAERGEEMERDYELRTKRFFADLPGPETIGRLAGERAARRLGARKIESQKAAVIFENRLAGRMLSPFLGAISGSAVARGVSFLKDKLGQRIFPENFDLREDPFVRRGAASRHFDGEGGAVAAAKLVDAGVVGAWMLNAATARQLNMKPNGHATSGHGGPPGLGASNLFVKPGPLGLDGLMGAAGKGLFVTDMFSPSLNMNSGDWSVGVAGYWFENGAVAHPVSEVTVAGNLLELYGRVVCGADLDDHGALEAPSLLFDDLAIGGV